MDSTREDLLLSDMVFKEKLTEICASLPTVKLLSVREVNKHFAAVATKELTSRKNRAALFARRTLLQREFVGDVNFSHSVNEMMATVKYLQGGAIDQIAILWLAAQVGLAYSQADQTMVRALVDKYHSYNIEARKIFWRLLRAYILTMDKDSCREYLPFVMGRISIRCEDCFEALQTLHCMIFKLDQIQLVVLVERIRVLAIHEYNEKWRQQFLDKLQPLLRDIASRLDHQTATSYVDLVVMEAKHGTCHDIVNWAILEAFADKLTPDNVEDLAKSLDEKYNISACWSKKSLLAKTKKMSPSAFQAVLKNYWLFLKGPDQKSKEVLQAAKIIFSTLEDPLLIKGYIDHVPMTLANLDMLSMTASFWTAEQVKSFTPLLKTSNPPLSIFIILETILEKLDPAELTMVLQNLPTDYDLRFPIVQEYVDDWFLSCHERLNSADRDIVYQKILASLEEQITAVGFYQNVRDIETLDRIRLNKRMVRLATLFSPEQAKNHYLPVALTFLSRCMSKADLALNVAPLRAVLMQMNDEDVREAVPKIIAAVSLDYINTPETIDLLVHFIATGICSLEDLKKMEKLNKRYLTADISIPLLEKIAEWRARFEAGQLTYKKHIKII